MEELTEICSAQTKELAGKHSGRTIRKKPDMQKQTSRHAMQLPCARAAKEAIIKYLKQKVETLEQALAERVPDKRTTEQENIRAEPLQTSKRYSWMFPIYRTTTMRRSLSLLPSVQFSPMVEI